MNKDFKIFWKVHRNNFHRFITYVDNYYSDYYLSYNNSKNDMFRLYENYYSDYLFVGLSYYTTTKNIILVSSSIYSEWLYTDIIRRDWIYQGEYNGRKEKLERLNELIGMNDL